MRQFRVLAWVVAVFVSLAGAARAETSPILMLDTGGHMAMIRSVIFTPDGSQLVSASDDKTIRVWDLATGKTVRTIRGEVGAGPAGQLFSMALSRDGRWLAVAGWTDQGVAEPCCGDLRLYDFATGQLVALLKGHTSAVYGLAFSSDGRYLISGSKDRTAIIWDMNARAQKHVLKGHTDDVYAVGFSPDGQRAVTGAFDHDLRIWNVADGSQIGVMHGHRDKVNTLAIGTDGTIASGDYAGEIRLWNGRTGGFIRTLAHQPTMVGALAFSPDGRHVLSTIAKLRTDRNPYGANVYSVIDGSEVVAYREHDNTVIAGNISPDGRWAATGGGNNHDIHVWDLQTGERRRGPDGKALTLGGVGRSIWSVGMAADGRIAWGATWTTDPARDFGPLEYVLSLPSAQEAVPEVRSLPMNESTDFARAEIRRGAWSINHREGGTFGYDNAILDIKEAGRARNSIERDAASGFGHWAYTIADQGQTIISGGANGWLDAHDLNGISLGNYVGHTSVIWAVAPSSDGRFLVSGSHDQTVKIWNLKTRELLATLFHGLNGEWVMWTPEGFFVSSENGASLVGWQINQGPNREARYVSAEQLRKVLYRPDLVAAKLQGDTGGKLQQEPNVNTILTKGAAPEVMLIGSDGVHATDRMINVRFKVKDNGGGIGRIELRVNGAVKGALFGTRGFADEKTGEITLPIELGATDNTIEIVAANRDDSIESLPVRVSVKVDKGALLGVPDLYILAIGANDYRDVRRKLDYAVPDAKTFGTVLSEAGTGYYRNKPTLITLADGEVTAERLSQVFDELGQKVKATDVFLFFIAGHGKNLRGDYYFVPPGIERFSEDSILKTGFGPKQWRDWFARIKAEKSVWIFDTCESGSAGKPFKGRGGSDYDTAHRRLIDATGRVVFMAASDQQLAVEGYHGHGVFTYSLLEGLARADANNDNQIELMELAQYIDRRVPEISRELKACVTASKDDYCQRPEVDWTRRPFYPLVPRYDAVLATLSGAAAVAAVSPIPTHVVLDNADLYEGAARGGNVVRQLQRGDPVTLVKAQDGWAQVAQDGKMIGYVEESRLLKMNR